MTATVAVQAYQLPKKKPTGFAEYGQWIEGLLLLAFSLVIAQHLITLPRPLTYEHAWVSADNALQARYFAHDGLAASKAIPVNNNPPWGISEAAYIHWPPLFPLGLALWFRTFGESESAIHSFVLLIQLATFGSLYMLLRSALDRTAAAIGGLIWLACPGNLRFGHAALHLHLAIFFLITASAVFQRTLDDPPERRRWIWGAVAIFLGVLSSWEAVLAPIGLIAAAWALSKRSAVRRGVVYLISGIAAAAGTLGWYLLNNRGIAADTLHTVLFRLGLAREYSSRLLYNQGGQDHLWLPAAIRAEGANLAGVVGVLGLASIAAYLVCQVDNYRSRTLQPHLAGFLGTFAPLLLWFAFFWNHAGIHAYESLLAVAPAAFAGAFLYSRVQSYLEDDGRGTAARRLALQVVLPAALLAPLVLNLYDSMRAVRSHDLNQPDAWVRMGRAIAAATPPGAIILTPERSLVPVWYSGRNTSRAIVNDRDAGEAVRQLGSIAPNAPVYLVLRPGDGALFPSLVRNGKATDIGGGLLSIRLPVSHR